MYRLVILPAAILTLSLALATFACDGGDEAAPTPTPTPTVTSAATPSPQSTPSSPEPSAIRISPPEDRGEFLEQFEDEQMTGERCTYGAAGGSADCGASGLYELDPPPPGDEVDCSVFLVEGQPVAVSCATETTAVLYAIP